MADQVRHRRRGEELEHAVLVAAWDELVDVGFASLTMESVAARARTGVAVLMTLRPVTPERIKSIVDDLFLPLVAADMTAANAVAANAVAGDRAV
jgi:hypothetical protein